ncbi:MAG: extracellular solute-binding protein [Deltaproteobacteria bacterium]|nr:extracellular solute-binding protein [Deltaproteobacteria bacterium]
MINKRRMVAVCLLSGLLLLLVPHFVTAKTEKKVVVLTRMMDMADRWFRKNIIAPFSKDHGIDIAVASFDKFWDLEVMLKLDRDSGKHAIGVVKVPLEMTRPLIDFMIPYDELMSNKALEELKIQYDSSAIEMGTINGKLYYLPRKLETRMMFYLKPKVKEAVDNWKRYEGRIIKALKADNDIGLPLGYQLEKDPNRWDYYDIFVVSYYWAHTPYYGIKLPRMAHRGKKYGGTVVGLVDRIYQMGGSVEDVLAMSTDPVVDMFVWEAVYKKSKLYNPGMWQDPWSGGGIWNGMKDGKVFLAMMHQIDSFFIHGGTHPQMQGYLVDPNDMGLAVMPMGGSFELNPAGRPYRVGSRAAGTSGWWWGIPKTSPDLATSLDLAKWITNHDNHLSECKIFGMMPIRKDILANLEKVFPEGWMGEVFDVSVKQLGLNGKKTVPLLPEYSKVGKIYLDAWYDIVVGDNYGPGGKIDRDYIKQRLQTVYLPKIKEIYKTGGK